MLGNFPVAPTIPITDVQKAKNFYQNILGLTLVKETPAGLTFKAQGDTTLFLYKRGPSKADHTLAGFTVDDVEKVVDELIAKGVVFEQYDFPGLKTNEKGIAVTEEEGGKAAWFKDPDGNILGIVKEM